MVQRIGGFYDGGESAKLTHIVGSGQSNKSEILRFNGTALATNPFSAVQGPNWDNPTFQLTPTAFPEPAEPDAGHDIGRPPGLQLLRLFDLGRDHLSNGSQGP